MNVDRQRYRAMTAAGSSPPPHDADARSSKWPSTVQRASGAISQAVLPASSGWTRAVTVAPPSVRSSVIRAGDASQLTRFVDCGSTAPQPTWTDAADVVIIRAPKHESPPSATAPDDSRPTSARVTG